MSGAWGDLLKCMLEDLEQADPMHLEVPTRAGDYDRFLTGYECVATNTLPFGYRTVDGYHSELRLYRRG